MQPGLLEERREDGRVGVGGTGQVPQSCVGLGKTWVFTPRQVAALEGYG